MKIVKRFLAWLSGLGTSSSAEDGLQFGDPCRTIQGAPARYLGGGRAVYISSMCNEVSVSGAMPALGNENLFPLPSDDEMREALGYSRQ